MILYSEKLRAPTAVAAVIAVSACAFNDPATMSRAYQLDATLAAVPGEECTFTLMSHKLAEDVLARPDSETVFADLSEACPGISIGVQPTEAGFQTASLTEGDDLTEPTGDGGTGDGGTGDGGTGDGGTGDGGTGDGGTGDGGTGDGGTGDGGTGDGGTGDGGTGDGGTGDGGTGGGSRGNNGGGNGSEGGSPGQGSGANNDE